MFPRSWNSFASAASFIAPATNGIGPAIPIRRSPRCAPGGGIQEAEVFHDGECRLRRSESAGAGDAYNIVLGDDPARGFRVTAVFAGGAAEWTAWARVRAGASFLRLSDV